MSRIILTHDVEGLGVPGDVVDVKNGYARNYLLPKGFAVSWTRGGEKQIDQIRAARTARELATAEEATAFKAALENAVVTLAARAGKDGRLFGSVTTTDIARAVEASGTGSIDKRKVRIPSAIKAVGEHSATVRLKDDVVATLTLQVVAS